MNQEVQVAIAAALYELFHSDEREVEVSQVAKSDTATTREICTAIGDLLYELLDSRDAQGKLSLGGSSNQRSPWSAKHLTLRRLPGQN